MGIRKTLRTNSMTSLLGTEICRSKSRRRMGWLSTPTPATRVPRRYGANGNSKWRGSGPDSLKELARSAVAGHRTDHQLLHRLALTLLVAAVGGAIVVSLGGFSLVNLGLAPVRRLASQTRAVSADNLHQRLDSAEQPLELVPLIDQFNALLARIEKAYLQMEGFNADVAHELCTPWPRSLPTMNWLCCALNGRICARSWRPTWRSCTA